MRMNKTFIAMALASVAAFGCGGGSNNGGDVDMANGGGNDMAGAGAEVAVSGDITGQVWTKDKVYRLKDFVYVTSGTLEIQAGTKILGDSNSALVISRGAKINAAGTKAEPIVMTSSKAVGSREKGDWGGLLVLGKAPILNKDATPEQIFEGLPATIGEKGTFGGNDPAHDCGVMKYMRIEFAGFKYAEDKELNGLTLSGCGNATVVDYVHAHLGNDDGVEVFGGTVNLKHIVISQPDDDGLDYDLGWTGKAQFVLVQQSGTLGDNGIEADGYNGDGTPANPSNPTIYNYTFIGRKGLGGTKISVGMLLRRSVLGKIYNSVITKAGTAAIDVRSKASGDALVAGTLAIRGTSFFDNEGQSASWPDTIDSNKQMENDSDMQDEYSFSVGQTENFTSDPGYADPQNLAAPKWTASAAFVTESAAKVKALPASDPFFETANFAGAVGADDWTAGWTAFPAN